MSSVGVLCCGMVFLVGVKFVIIVIRQRSPSFFLSAGLLVYFCPYKFNSFRLYDSIRIRFFSFLSFKFLFVFLYNKIIYISIIF